jgi:hypothetical protein
LVFVIFVAFVSFVAAAVGRLSVLPKGGPPAWILESVMFLPHLCHDFIVYSL